MFTYSALHLEKNFLYMIFLRPMLIHKIKSRSILQPIRYQRVTSRQLPIRSSMDQIDCQPVRSFIRQSPSLQLRDASPDAHIRPPASNNQDNERVQPLSRIRHSPSVSSSLSMHSAATLWYKSMWKRLLDALKGIAIKQTLNCLYSGFQCETVDIKPLSL